MSSLRGTRTPAPLERVTLLRLTGVSLLVRSDLLFLRWNKLSYAPVCLLHFAFSLRGSTRFELSSGADSHHRDDGERTMKASRGLALAQAIARGEDSVVKVCMFVGISR